MRYVNQIIEKLSRMATNMDTGSCLILVCIVLTVGFVCMRGFGSRNNY